LSDNTQTIVEESDEGEEIPFWSFNVKANSNMKFLKKSTKQIANKREREKKHAMKNQKRKKDLNLRISNISRKLK
jgi:hypothetical protein